MSRGLPIEKMPYEGIPSSPDEPMPSAESVDLFATQLKLVVDELEGLSCRAEQQFLSIGGQLHGLYQRASGVSQQATVIFDMLLGERAEAVRSGLESLLDRFSEHLHQVLLMADQGKQTLGELLELLERLPEPLSGYREIAKTLQMLGISTRIESSGPERTAGGFQLLGAELKSLEQGIDLKVEKILGRLDSLDSLCRKARHQVARIESRRSELIGEGDQLANSLMMAVAEKNRLAGETARTLSSRSNEITASIGEIVTSLQYQDITRQQIEHVRLSLDEVRTELGTLRADENYRGGAEVLQVAGEVCRIQAAQLNHTRDELDSAIKRILDALLDVSGTVTAIAADMQLAAGATERDGGTVFSEFEEAINRISVTLNQEIETTREAERAIGSVLAEGTAMSELVSEINRIGLEMKVIALNAGINAVNVGGGLPSMDVIARGTQQLSKKVFNQTAAVAVGLEDLISSSQQLSGYAPEASGQVSLAQLQELSQESASLLKSLQQLYAELVERLGSMENSSRALADDIGAVASSFTIHTDSRDTIGTGLAVLEQMAEQAGASDRTVLDDRYLHMLRERFTMQSERDIFNRAQATDISGETPAEKVPEHDFGDNVEFF